MYSHLGSTTHTIQGIHRYIHTYREYKGVFSSRINYTDIQGIHRYIHTYREYTGVFSYRINYTYNTGNTQIHTHIQRIQGCILM